MATTKSELKALVAAVETMRASLYDDLSPQFVRQVVEIEAKYSQDPTKALEKIRKLVREEVARRNPDEGQV